MTHPWILENHAPAAEAAAKSAAKSASASWECAEMMPFLFLQCCMTFICKIADPERQFQGEEMYNMQDDCTKLSETDIFAGGLTWGKKDFLAVCCFML